MKRMFLLFLSTFLYAQKLLIPMDLAQTDHLKAYGIAFCALEEGRNVEWLLNYRSGSFLMSSDQKIIRLCRIRGVIYESVDSDEINRIYQIMDNNNMDIVFLEKAPDIAVYTPPNKQPWDDAVTLALSYSEIPYKTLFDKEVLRGDLFKYDWLHLHHEDFTGQYGKFYASYRNSNWYVEQQNLFEAEAKKQGYSKVSQHKLAVVLAIRNYIIDGGFLFAMCSATDSYDIAISARNTDICDIVFDHDPVDENFSEKINYTQSLAFESFSIYTNPLLYEFSNIDITPPGHSLPSDASLDYFTLFEFSAKYDPVPTMLTQNHVSIIHNFMGQTSGFHKDLIKNSVTILAEKEGTDQVKYLHGNAGQGTFTFLGGHDPEDYQHFVGDPPTELKLYKNSPGYRLILNNILFPAAKKRERKT